MRLSHMTSCATLAGVVIVASAASGQYTFIKVADSSGPLGTEFGWPDINDDGTVVFRNILDDGVNTAIYTGNGGPLTPQVSTLRTFSKLEFAPTINNAGAVAFWAEKPPIGGGIYSVLNGVVTTVANAQNSPFYNFNYLPAINDSGTVVYNGNLTDPCCISAFGVGASVMYDALGPFVFFGAGTINNSGTAAFMASLDNGTWGVFSGSGGAHTTIALDSATFNVLTPGQINDSGAVAFTALLPGNVRGIYVGNGGPLTTVTTTAGPYNTFAFGGVGLNNNGDVAFWAILDATGNSGIFTGPDPATDTIIKAGDQLFGSTVYGVDFVHGLNNHGDVAFTYVLENESGGAGLHGVAIAKAPRAALVGDIDGDGDVDAADLSVLLGAWGTNNPAADLNGDGVVNAADLALLLGSWT